MPATAKTNAVIYARYSSANQTEQSIEGQLRYCRNYAAQHGYTIVHEYIDRAQSGTTDNRPDFQQMIRDSAKKQFQTVIKGDKDTQAALIVEPGGKLIAEGTKDAPIVFTSEQPKGCLLYTSRCV